MEAESVRGYETLAEHFPSGLTDPTRVIAATDRADAIGRAILETPGVVSATPAGQTSTGLTQWSVILDAEPASEQAFRPSTRCAVRYRPSTMRRWSADRTPPHETPAPPLRVTAPS